MGSYCTLYISDFPIINSKSYVIPESMTLFRESDKVICERKLSERNKIVWGENEGEDENEIIVEYRAPIKHIRQRLDVLGFTYKRAQREFDSIMVAKIIELENMSENNYFLEEINLLKNSTLGDFLEAFKLIIKNGVPLYRYIEAFPESDPIIKYIVQDQDELIWGFPCSDPRCFLRVLVEILPENAEVVQELTEVVHAGYYSNDDKVCDLSYEYLVNEYPISSRIIILTEGKTDSEILRRSMNLLYPQLFGYYTFMDFGIKPAGGAGDLVNIVKSFAGSGIKNRIIALFDNDTAAYSAVSILDKRLIPSNIVIQHYPSVELATDYPTLGPNGLITQNINNLACSIELYFGSDILKINSDFVPIQWTGLEERLKRYQGSILRKNELQESFFKKLKICENNRDELLNTDWSGIEIILQQIFQAFIE
jgi:hypothetical protein